MQNVANQTKSQSYQTFFFVKQRFCLFLLLSLDILNINNIFVCNKHSNLTTKIRKRRKMRFGRIDSWIHKKYYLLSYIEAATSNNYFCSPLFKIVQKSPFCQKMFSDFCVRHKSNGLILILGLIVVKNILFWKIQTSLPYLKWPIAKPSC